MMEPCDLTLQEAGQRLRAGTFRSENLVDSVLARITATEPYLHAYVSVAADEALIAAGVADRLFEQGIDCGPLQGIPVAVKDIFDQAGWPTRCGSRVREHIPPAKKDAAAVAMARAGGAVLIGKTVTQEFAAGVVSDPARNPWDPSRIPAGSSGGSASAVAAGSAMAAFGSDTGGSIRAPASVCGIAGLKPTFDTISTAGVFPLAWSLDTVGPLARTVGDVSLVFEALVGKERFDAGVLFGQYTGSLRGKRIGVSRPHFVDRLQAGVAARVEEAIVAFARLGAEIVETPWTGAGAARAAGFVINRVESASVHEEGLLMHPNLYGVELRLRLETNRFVPALWYVKALKARRVLKASMAELFEEHRLDALLAPATPGVASPADDLYVVYDDGSREHVSLAYTRLTMPFNLTGQPVLSIPCGLDGAGLPVGLQLAGRPGDEIGLCGLGLAFESTDTGRPVRPPRRDAA